MGRQRKISDENLLEIVKKYLSEHKYIVKLKYSDLIIYSKKMGYENLIYQDFSRSKIIKQFVDTYNKRNRLNDYILSNNIEFNKLDFNIDTILEKNYKNKNQLKTILRIYKNIYDEAFLKIEALENEKKEITNRLIESNELLREQEKFIKELKVKNTSLRRDMKCLKEKNKDDKEIADQEFIILAIEYLLEKKKIVINNEMQLIDILKNLGYKKREDLFNYDELIKETIKDSDKKERDNIIKIEKKKPKLPNFIK